MRSAMCLVCHYVGNAARCGHHVGCVERTLHKALVEVAGDWHVVASAGEGADAALVQYAGYHIEGIPSAGSIACNLLLQGTPYTVVEALLPLRCLVGVIESLVVLLCRRLPVVRCHQVTAAVPHAACIVEPGLLGKAYGRV